MDTSYGSGLVIGFAVVLLILFIWTLKKGEGGSRSHYDERQKQIQAKGYKIGYMTMIGISIVIMIILELGKPLLFSSGMWVLMAVVTSGLVSASYMIIRGAYIEYDKKGTRQLLLFALLGAANLASTVTQGVQGNLFVHGIITLESGGNLACGLVFVVLFLVILIRRYADKGESEEE